ncbi:MAG: 3TM-type holin [Rhodospirillales bacterium]
MIGLISSVAGPLLKGLFDIVDQTVENKDQAAKIKSVLQQKVLDGQMKEIEAAANIIVAEATGESWLQRNWRPMLMCLFGVIVANNYVVVPIFGTAAAEIPDDMWELLKIGIGGYVVGRSVEKGIKVWKRPA